MVNNLILTAIKNCCKQFGYQLYNESSIQMFSKFTQDSRLVDKNDVYIALKGEHFDGHDFIKDAIEKFASLIISERKLDIDTAYLKCDNSLKCLQEIAREYRQLHRGKFIGLTGSSGKTSTKELLYSVLSEKYSVDATQGNYNNHIGLPLSILNTKEDAEFAIIELGTNHPGEIRFLTEILDPDYAYITNIGYGHIGNFNSIKELYTEKTDLFRFSRKTCKLYINKDDNLLKEYKDEREQYHFSYQDLITDLNPNEIGAYSFKYQNLEVHLKLLGKHQLINAIAAVVIASGLGLSPSEIKSGLEKTEVVKGRMQGLELSPYFIINDAYNANPGSMTKALEYLDELEHETKIAVLGDMLELGKQSISLHQEIIERFNVSTITEIILFGEIFSKANKVGIKCFQSKEDIVNYILDKYKKGIILIKSSNSIGLQDLLSMFEEKRRLC